MNSKMLMRLLTVMVVASLVPAIQARARRYSRMQPNALSKTRCDLMCFDRDKETKGTCRSQCRNQEHKPGKCPVSDTPKWEAACVQACNSDSQCDGTQRCCHHGCGSTCSEPLDLLTLPGLPAVPTMEEPKEKRRAVVLRWSDGVGDTARAVPGRVLYLLEEQHHLGPKYEQSRLGDWNLMLRTNRTKVSPRNLLKPGRWYRFRVAAISASGTRGFSDPCPPFTPRRGPRPPPMPKKLRVRPMRMDNGTMTVRLEWKEPRSDLPVMRYKVFWSRRVRGLGGELDSVLVNHQTVSKDQNHIEIKDLQPNSMYFLQVQTISQFGLGKLRSDKASVFYNTTGSVGNDSVPESLIRRDRYIKGLKLNKIVWNNQRLKARISWESVPSGNNGGRSQERYYVHWKTIKCNKTDKPMKDLAATTAQSTFELYELDYHCSYKVNVNRSWKNKIPESELVITIPGCQYFKRKVNVTAITCDS